MTEREENIQQTVMKDEMKKIRKHVGKLLEKYGALEDRIEISRASKTGDNYISAIYRVTIKVISVNLEEKELNFIVKRPPIDQARRETVHFDSMFSRELHFYREVMPIFDEFLAENDRKLELFPKLHTAITDYGDETLVIEDLKQSGYRLHTSKMLDYQHLAITLRFLGRFHAYSFALRVKKPDKFEKLKSIEEPLFREPKPGHHPRLKRPTMLCDIIAKALADEDVLYRERFARFGDKYEESMIETVRESASEPYAVVNHGDVWTNNILFKYPSHIQFQSEEGPLDLRFVDFQLCRYASPVLDILYLLFGCCTYSIREHFYDTLLDVYYDAFSSSLESFGCDSSILFPRRVLSQHLKRFGKFAAGMAVYVVHVFSDDEGQEVATDAIEKKLNVKVLERKLDTDPFYKRTIIETFRDLTDRDYI